MKKHYLLSLASIILIFMFLSCRKDKETVNPAEPVITYNNFIKVESEYVVDAEEVEDFFQEIAGDYNLSMFGVTWHPLKVVTIRYKTLDEHQNETEASGIVAYYEGLESYNGLYSVQHGTCELGFAPSNLRMSAESMPVILGYVVSMPDYLGYGLSENTERFHPYMNQDNTATVCYDMLTASKEYLSSISLNPGNDNKINLMGYSQGGAATVALQKKIESAGKYTLDKVYAGGAPLNLTESFNYVIEQGDNYYTPSYSLLIFNSMDKSYDLNLDYSMIFQPEYVDAVNLLKSNYLYEIDEILGSNMHNIFVEDFFVPDHNGNTELEKLYQAFDRNNLLVDFQPQTHLFLYHTPNDDQVPYINAQLASETYSNCTIKDMAAENHVSGAYEFFIRALLGGIK